MTWGSCYMYYHCPQCGQKFKYAVDMISAFGESFGWCPWCEVKGVLEQEGARIITDILYKEVE